MLTSAGNPQISMVGKRRQPGQPARPPPGQGQGQGQGQGRGQLLKGEYCPGQGQGRRLGPCRGRGLGQWQARATMVKRKAEFRGKGNPVPPWRVQTPWHGDEKGGRSLRIYGKDNCQGHDQSRKRYECLGAKECRRYEDLGAKEFEDYLGSFTCGCEEPYCVGCRADQTRLEMLSEYETRRNLARLTNQARVGKIPVSHSSACELQ
jgi:hypothetical protein